MLIWAVNSVILFKVIKLLSEQFNSCLNNKQTGLSEVDSTFCIDMNWTWCQWKMLFSKLWCRWGEEVDQVVASSFSSSISLTISSLLLFPSHLLFLHLVLGDAVPPMSWSAKPSTQVEGIGIWHSVHFLEVAGFTGVTWGHGLLWEHGLVRHTLRWMQTWMQLRNCKKACWSHWYYTYRSTKLSYFFSG